MISPQQHMEVLHKGVAGDPIMEAEITVIHTMLQEAGAADSATEDDPVRMRRYSFCCHHWCANPVCDITTSAFSQGVILRTVGCAASRGEFAMIGAENRAADAIHSPLSTP
jgi:hypothetical protein